MSKIEKLARIQALFWRTYRQLEPIYPDMPLHRQKGKVRRNLNRWLYMKQLMDGIEKLVEELKLDEAYRKALKDRKDLIQP